MDTLADMTWEIAVARKMYDVLVKYDFLEDPIPFDELDEEDKLTLCLAARVAQ